MAVALCSECETPLRYPEGHPQAGQPKPAGTMTCGTSTCRSRRARRLKKERAEVRAARRKPRDAIELLDMAAVTREEMKDAAHEVMKEELVPVVREAMTAEVLRSIDALVKLTPRAIERLEEDMSSEDEVIRQRAYTLLLKYTMGNPSVAPPPAEVAPAAMNVVFNIPRPGDAPEPPPALPAEADELRACSVCLESKVPADFVGDSDCCQDCFDARQAKLAARFQ